MNIPSHIPTHGNSATSPLEVQMRIYSDGEGLEKAKARRAAKLESEADASSTDKAEAPPKFGQGGSYLA